MISLKGRHLQMGQHTCIEHQVRNDSMAAHGHKTQNPDWKTICHAQQGRTTSKNSQRSASGEGLDGVQLETGTLHSSILCSWRTDAGGPIKTKPA